MIGILMISIFIYAFFVVIWTIISIAKTGKIKVERIWLATIPIYLILASIPFLFVYGLFGNNRGIVILVITIILGYLIIRLGITIYNKMKVKLSKNEGIYIRDVEVEYSPAILSYLQNQKIEKKKDLVACILNLCAKGFLKIEKKEENRYELKALPNKDDETLKKDEKYLYNKIYKKEKINLNTWIRYVREEFESYHFTKETKIRLSTIFLLLYIGGMIILAIYSTVSGNQIGQEISDMIFITFFVAFELAILEPLIRVILRYLRKGEYLDGTYTGKGAKEMKRWDKYKKFLEEYTLLEDKPLESVLVLEKHLAYATVLNVNTSYTKSFIEQLEITHKINLEYVDKMLEEINKEA